MFPRWLAWIFLAFLAYVLFTSNWGQPTTNRAAPEKITYEQDYPAIQALMDGNRWRRALNPDYNVKDTPCAALKRQADRLGSYALVEAGGSGEPVGCGGDIHLYLRVWDAKGFEAKEVGGLRLELGKQPGLDALLVGMRIGETRTIVMPVPGAGYRAIPALRKGQVQIFTVTRGPGPGEAPPKPEAAPETTEPSADKAAPATDAPADTAPAAKAPKDTAPQPKDAAAPKATPAAKEPANKTPAKPKAKPEAGLPQQPVT